MNDEVGANVIIGEGSERSSPVSQRPVVFSRSRRYSMGSNSNAGELKVFDDREVMVKNGKFYKITVGVLFSISSTTASICTNSKRQRIHNSKSSKSASSCFPWFVFTNCTSDKA